MSRESQTVVDQWTRVFVGVFPNGEVAVAEQSFGDWSVYDLRYREEIASVSPVEDPDVAAAALLSAAQQPGAFWHGVTSVKPALWRPEP